MQTLAGVIITENDLHLETIQLKKAALIIRAINHKLRQQFLRLLHEKGQMTVTELYIKLRLEQSVTSQHLAILRKAGLVNTRRENKFVYYSVNHERLSELNEVAGQLNPSW